MLLEPHPKPNNFKTQQEDDEALKLLSLRAAAATASSTVYGAVQKETRVERYMYAADGNRFYVKEIGYQTQGAFPSFSFSSHSSMLTMHRPDRLRP